MPLLSKRITFVSMNNKKTIGIFCGGYSSEWEISLKSAQTIQDNFPEPYRVIKILVSKEGWKSEVDGQVFAFDMNTMSVLGKEKLRIDAGLVYVHGDPGENGKIQALLEMHSIPHINSGPLASALSFDKWYCNQFLKGFDIHVAKSLFLSSKDDFSPEEIAEKLGLPVFVKPSDSGSSYGISKVKRISDISLALENAFKEGKTVVIESFLDGKEVTCGVYRRKDGVYALPLTEIASENEFFDYEAKYLGKSQEITPARVSEEVKQEVQRQAIFIYELLKLRSIARIDFMLVNGIPHVIEVNTTPGFSPASIVPQMINCDGGTIKEFWEEIVAVELINC
jgi:D-alanine-D-alanine ligase